MRQCQWAVMPSFKLLSRPVTPHSVRGRSHRHCNASLQFLPDWESVIVGSRFSHRLLSRSALHALYFNLDALDACAPIEWQTHNGTHTKTTFLHSWFFCSRKCGLLPNAWTDATQWPVVRCPSRLRTIHKTRHRGTDSFGLPSFTQALTESVLAFFFGLSSAPSVPWRGLSFFSFSTLHSFSWLFGNSRV